MRVEIVRGDEFQWSATANALRLGPRERSLYTPSTPFRTFDLEKTWKQNGSPGHAKATKSGTTTTIDTEHFLNEALDCRQAPFWLGRRPGNHVGHRLRATYRFVTSSNRIPHRRRRVQWIWVWDNIPNGNKISESARIPDWVFSRRTARAWKRSVEAAIDDLGEFALREAGIVRTMAQPTARFGLWRKWPSAARIKLHINPTNLVTTSTQRYACLVNRKIPQVRRCR